MKIVVNLKTKTEERMLTAFLDSMKIAYHSANKTDENLATYKEFINEYNNEIVKWTYKHAFPTSLGEISFNNRTSGEIDTTLQFAFAEIECVLL
jgi:uncharacterized protein YaaR (DUF327 family)